MLPNYRRDDGTTHPPLLSPGYKSTVPRAPREQFVLLPHSLTEVTGPLLGEGRVTAADADLTLAPGGEAQGQRIVVHGQVRDAGGRPIPHTLVEVWQSNAAGRYQHRWDQHHAPLDPHFTGVGRCLTDADGHYRFVTVKPGAYPWGNHPNAWRPAHIHFSLLGRAFTQRLVTQMYFPDDPLFAYDPIFNSVRDERARARLIAKFDLSATVEAWALGFRFDIVLAGEDGTPTEDPHDD
ncbi:protocatechuate 3,4-dioxygenase beta subunit [Catenuloplanes nepalensis]|uniref:Protocatechuate 3,4-dioxygenase beta subunit n=1 Tax=Catenuloplanes nepalensis TaxID=587533 RepID=A0ABT9MZ10_9ACTN|nr:protocatechuate 3,4-dioxygenase subunit beta [Catenuloplanes nepalensis]MDP9796692.1 protocatechuate 3,4-dioxygenase beta subunit [Catenuloplanes nepalensis]